MLENDLRFKSRRENPRFKVNGSRAECYKRKSNESKGKERVRE